MKLKLLEMLLIDEKVCNESVSDSNKNDHPYEIGKNYHIRTVTMAIAGKLKAVYQNELVFEKASWVADTGRYNEYLKDTEKVQENEPFVNDVIVGRGALIDMTEIDTIYTHVK